MEKIKKLLYIDKPEEFYAADIVDIQRKYLEEFETILYVDREINKTIILSQAFDLRYFIKKIFGFDYETSEHYHVGKIKGLDYFYWKIPVNILEFLRKMENFTSAKVITYSEIQKSETSTINWQ